MLLTSSTPLEQVSVNRVKIGEAHVRAVVHIRAWAQELAAHEESRQIADAIEHGALLLHVHGSCVIDYDHVSLDHLVRLRERVRSQTKVLTTRSAMIAAAAGHIDGWLDHLDRTHIRHLSSLEVAR